MRRQRLVPLIVLSLLVVMGAIWLSSQRNMPRDDTAGARVVPALAAAVNDVSEVRLLKGGEQATVTLKRTATNWQVAERANHPADSAKLRKLLIDLSDLKVVEQKTANPANYAVVGVEDVTAADATGVRIELDGLQEPVSLIVGKRAGSRSSYVRLANSDQSLEVAPALTLDTDPKNWLDRSVLDVAADRVQQVRVTEAKGITYTAQRESRDQTDFTVPDLPRGRTLSSPTAANSASTALAALSADDIRRMAADEPWNKDVTRAEFRLFDGTIVDIQGRKEGEQHWIRLSTRFDEAQNQLFATPAASATKNGTAAASPAATERKPDDVRAEAEKLAARFAGWAYEIPAYKYDSLFRPLDELTQKP